MLKLRIELPESFDEETNEFTANYVDLELEHSLLSLSKWESIHQKPFGSKEDKTTYETIDYVRCMNLTPDVPDVVFDFLSPDNFEAINNYINEPHHGTTFRDEFPEKNPTKQIISAELIYYWMFSNGIDKSCEEWHLNKLLALIRVFSIQNAPSKKLAPGEAARRRRELNERRIAEMKSKKG